MGDNTTEPEGEVAGATAEGDKNAMSSKVEHTTSEATDLDGGAKGEAKSELDGESPEKGGAEDVDKALPNTGKQNDKEVASASAAEDTAYETAEGDNNEREPAVVSSSPVSVPIVSSSKKSRPPYKFDPEKITLRFLFANRDGLTVTVECRPGDTVGEVKAALLSVWPNDLPGCSGGDRLRLICMGRGMLMPDTRTLEECQIPVFKTHPTPVNVSVKPEAHQVESAKSANEKNPRANTPGNPAGETGEQTSQGCACVIL